jgi:4-amino-4-deoxy-L-arabinose transferase-like glycosyltransferase
MPPSRSRAPSSHTGGPAPPGLVLRWAPPLLLLGYAVCCVFCWAGSWWWPEWDSALYILTGQSLARGEGYTYLDRPFFLRPPGLPFLIALVLGDGPVDGVALNRLMMVFAGLAVSGVYAALRPRHGRRVALGVALLVASSPLFTVRLNRVESELPFMALLYLAMALLLRAERTGRIGWITALSGGACLAGAFYMRSAGVLLVPGLLLLGGLARSAPQRWRAWLPALVAIALVLPWLQQAREAAATAEVPSEQLLVFDYSTAIFHVNPSDPGSDPLPLAGWARRLSRNGASLLRALGGIASGVESLAVGACVAALGLAGLVRAGRAGPSLLEWWTLSYAGLLLIYFTFNTRLVLPLLPFAFLYPVLGLGGLVRWAARRRPAGSDRRSRVAVAVLLVLLLAGNLARHSEIPHPRTRVSGGVREPGPWESGYLLAERIRAATPEDAVFLADAAPVFSVLTGRRFYSFRHQPGRQLLDRYDPDYVVLYRYAAASHEFLTVLESDPHRSWVLSERLSTASRGVFRAVAR